MESPSTTLQGVQFVEWPGVGHVVVVAVVEHGSGLSGSTRTQTYTIVSTASGHKFHLKVAPGAHKPHLKVPQQKNLIHKTKSFLTTPYGVVLPPNTFSFYTAYTILRRGHGEARIQRARGIPLLILLGLVIQIILSTT